MSGLLLDKAAIILGASRGIGAATARTFVAHGAKVVVASRDTEALQALAAELGGAPKAYAFTTDMTDPQRVADAVEFAVRKLGRLDLAFNNAGISPARVAFAELTDAAFDATMNVNLRGIFVAMKHEIRAMLATGGGSIVNTGSVGSLVALPQMAAYVASKHALAGLTKTAALEYAPHNIRVNLIAPGPVLTEMLKAGAASTAAGRARLEAATPMARIASAEEIAESVAWLSSPAASYLTGAVIPADGGYTVG